MKAVILAAGEGKRMHPLTKDTPKPMLHLAGRPLLEHLLESLPASVDEVILVVGYRAEQIKTHFGERFSRFRIHYVHQEKPEGTARALALCKDLIGQERFLSLYGDDLHGKEDLEALLEHPLSVLVKEVKNPEQFGVVIVGEGNRVVSIVEKPSHPTNNLVVTGPAVLDERIFEFDPPEHSNGEFFLAEAIGKLVEFHPIVAVVENFWLPIGYPKDLERAAEILSAQSREETRI